MPGFFDADQYTPLSGDARQQFREWHWGRRGKGKSTPVEYTGTLRQDLVLLGKLRALLFDDGSSPVMGRPYPLLAGGARDGRLYVVGGSTAKMARAGRWGEPGFARELEAIHYEAKKGARSSVVYWTHPFEGERPWYVVGADGWPRIEGGSYFLSDAGIVG